MMPNSCSEAISLNSSAMYINGLSNGKVSVLKVNHAPAPSTCAASNGDLGSDCMPASTSKITNGMFTQVSIKTTVNIAVLLDAAHGKLNIPNRFRNFSSTPTVLLVISCHTSTAMAGATINGNVKSTFSTRLNGFSRRSSSATQLPSSICTPVHSTAYSSVTSSE